MTQDQQKRMIRGYEVRESIGKGGYGAVYRAYQPTIEREVAMKVILPDYANQPEFIRRFEVEAQTVARLEHPFIVPLFDYWRDPNGAFLVMRWLRGGSLRSYLQTHTLTLDGVYQLLVQIGSSLALAHRSGVIHRDLKPENILLDEEGNGYLSDFGIAKVLDSGDTESTGDGTVMGSPAYLSPEQLRDQPVSPQTDIYSLGIMIYELLVGEHPFVGAERGSLLFKHLQTPIPTLDEVAPDLPYQLDQVLQTATAKEASERYESVTELVADFRSAMSGSVSYQTNLASGFTIGDDTIEINFDEIDNPYKGLRPFDEADADDFFGRTALVETLLNHLREGNSFLALVGPSGSGKSSVLRAGMIPELRRGAVAGSADWFYVDMVPGSDPLKQLEAALVSVAIEPPQHLLEQLRSDERGLLWALDRVLQGTKGDLFLLIDQFEELFTQITDEDVRKHFMAVIHTAVTAEQSRLRVVINLRADFYDKPLLYEAFGALVQANTQVVLPMTPVEIEQVITGPAHNNGLIVDSELMAAVINDVRQEPGVLPLLQYALTEVFEHREENRLTLDGYLTIGGVIGALARRAEEVFANKLTEEQQNAARQMFLRLVTPGEGTEDTRRRVRRSELRHLIDGEVLDSILTAFGQYRLLTFDNDPDTREPMVEVAHEALIREWSRLREWLDDYREDIRDQRQLAEAARQWIASEHDPSYLLRGGRLAQFEEFYNTTDLILTDLEQEFLGTSFAEREREQNRELAQRRREARQRQLLVRLTVIFAVVALIAAVLAGYSLMQRQVIQRERDNAQIARGTSEANAAEAQRQQETAVAAASTAVSAQALAEQQALEAQSLVLVSNAQAQKNSDPGLALALAVAANRFDQPPSQALHTLFEFVLAPGPRVSLGGHSGSVLAVDATDDGGLVISGGVNGEVLLWDGATGELIHRLEGHGETVNAVALSPDGELALSGDATGALILWSTRSGGKLRNFLMEAAAITALDWSPDGELAASATGDGNVWVWDVNTGDVRESLAGDGVRVNSLAFDPTGNTLLTGNDDGGLVQWSLAFGVLLQQMQMERSIVGVGYIGDGQQVVSAANDGTINLWDLKTGTVNRSYQGHSTRLRGLVTTQAGMFYTFAGDREREGQVGFGEIIEWSTFGGSPELILRGHSAPIQAATLTGDTETLITASRDGLVLIWDLRAPTLETARYNNPGNGLTAVAANPNRETVVAASGLLNITTGEPGSRTLDGRARLWDVETRESLGDFRVHNGLILDLAFLPRNEEVLSVSDNGEFRRWNSRTGEIISEYLGHQERIRTVAVNREGTQALTGSDDTNVMLWDVETREILWLLEGHSAAVHTVAFSPDGQTAYSGSADTSIIAWDLAGGVLRQRLDPSPDTITSIDVQPSGEHLVYGSLDRVGVIDIASGEEVLRVEATGNVAQVRFTPDGQVIAVASRGGVQLFDAASGDLVHTFADAVPTWDLAFSADGEQMLTAALDGNARQYPVTSAALVAWTRDHRYVRGFTCAERVQYRIEPLCLPFED